MGLWVNANRLSHKKPPQRINFSVAPGCSSHSIFSLSPSGLLPLFPPCYLLTEISFQRRKKEKKKLGRDGAPVQSVQPMTAVPQKQEVGQWWSPVCFSSSFLFTWGQTLPLTSWLTFPGTKGPSLYVRFLLYLLCKIQEKLLVVCPLVHRPDVWTEKDHISSVLQPRRDHLTRWDLTFFSFGLPANC